jgi:hypothetical protein
MKHLSKGMAYDAFGEEETINETAQRTTPARQKPQERRIRTLGLPVIPG